MRVRAVALAAALSLGLAACDAPTGTQQPLPPETVLTVAAGVEQQFRSQIGKPQGSPLRFSYRRVSRQGAHITTAILFEDDVVIQLAKQDPERFSASFQDAFKRSMCGTPEVRLVINSGMKITTQFLDNSGRVVFARTLDRC